MAVENSVDGVVPSLVQRVPRSAMLVVSKRRFGPTVAANWHRRVCSESCYGAQWPFIDGESERLEEENHKKSGAAQFG